MTTQLRHYLSLGRTAAALVLVLTCFVQTPVLAATAYLSDVGPPTIRFDSPSRRGTIFPTEFDYDESKPKPPAKAESLIAPTLAAISTNLPAVLASTATPSATGTNYSMSSFPIQSAVTSSQQSVADISVVTPQMVMNYLKPDGRTPGDADGKGTATLIPVKIGFMPPMQINNSSTAVYKRE